MIFGFFSSQNLLIGQRKDVIGVIDGTPRHIFSEKDSYTRGGAQSLVGLLASRNQQLLESEFTHGKRAVTNKGQMKPFGLQSLFLLLHPFTNGKQVCE